MDSATIPITSRGRDVDIYGRIIRSGGLEIKEERTDADPSSMRSRRRWKGKASEGFDEQVTWSSIRSDG
jgi:hypothetical protein